MEPRIQYAKTEDGVDIAYYVVGHGPPFVTIGGIPFSHIQLEWEMDDVRALGTRAAAERFTAVRFDPRGTGSSTRDVSDLSLDALVRDLEAVVDKLGLQSFALLGGNEGGPPAMTFAARNPDRVSRLVLLNTYARRQDVLDTPEGQAFLALHEQDWTIYTETAAHIMYGWSDEAESKRGAFYRECVSREGAIAAMRALRELDVSHLLEEIKAPTLVASGASWPPVEFSRALAAQIPNARLITARDLPAAFAAIGAFLNEWRDEEMQAPPLPSGMTAILFLDIADSTELTTKLGDAAYREQERELDASLRGAIREAGGTPVEGKVLGDGVMAVFTSARQAIEAAQRCRDLGNEAGLPLHLGIHAGDVVREGNHVHGGAVQVAARVQGVAEPGEILVSATVRDLARTSAGVAFEDRGEHEMKGIPEPQRLFAVRDSD